MNKKTYKKWTIEELNKLPKTRGEAITQGGRYYFSKRLCKHGHIAPRLRDGKCSKCKSLREHRRRQSLEKNINEPINKRIDINKLIKDGLPKTSREAKESNNKYYYTGKKCINGHLSPRYTNSKGCFECSYESSRQYAKNKPQDTNKIVDHSSDHFSINNLLLISAKARARRKGINFNLNFADIDVPEYCPILGIKLDKTWGGVEQTNKQRANKCSLDRIDSKKGYIKGNVIVISYRANMIKGDGSADEHRAIAKYINNETVKYKKL